MKIRVGFVANSSSTSFTFLTKKSGKSELVKQILEHYTKFNLTHVSPAFLDTECVYHCTAEDVCEAIKVLTARQPQKIDKCIEEEKQEIEQSKKWWEDSKSLCADERSMSLHEKWHEEALSDMMKKVIWLEQAKSQGFTHVFEVKFGDNDGDFSGGNVGITMDYEGRYIDIDDESFKVKTEQAR